VSLINPEASVIFLCTVKSVINSAQGQRTRSCDKTEIQDSITIPWY